MRRTAVIVVALGIVGGVVGGAAGKKSSARVVVEPYRPNPYSHIVIGTLNPGLSVTSVELDAYPGERAIKVVLTDETGTPTRATITQDRKTLAEFCGETGSAVPIDPSVPILIDIFSGPCNGSLAVATEGTAEVKFLGASRP